MYNCTCIVSRSGFCFHLIKMQTTLHFLYVALVNFLIYCYLINRHFYSFHHRSGDSNIRGGTAKVNDSRDS